MKLYEIKAVAKYLKEFHFIKNAKRVENNVIEINFGNKESIFFDLTRGNATIYLAPKTKNIPFFNAPFDVLLHQNMSHAKVLDVICPEDKIIIFKLQPKSQYKNLEVEVRFELTSKYTNCIIVDKNQKVLEALRHIDSSKSYREVKPGVILKELKPFKSKFSEGTIESVEALLKENYQKRVTTLLERNKKQKLYNLEKKLQKLQQLLHTLPNKEVLQQEANLYNNYASVILANLHTIKPYQEKLETVDFEGKNIAIPLPKNIAVNRMGEYYFNLARRAKNKAKHIEIEKENLMQKLNFYQNLKEALLQCQDLYELELLYPSKKQKAKRKKEKDKVGEIFWIEGYKIMVGRSAKENIELLKMARANDIWMHVRDIPGSHLIIRTDKKNLPLSVIESAAKLCVDFSTKKAGNYEVDYTRRKFVKITHGSNVEYDKFQTVHILKEGVEIRV